MRQFFCLLCSALVWKRETLFCKFCKVNLLKTNGLIQKRDQEGVPHYYVFKWTEQSDFLCRAIVYFLKNKPPSFFNDWAGLFRIISDFKNFSAVVPSSSEEVNHAKSLSLSILKPFDLSGVYEVRVKKKGLKEQKKLSRAKRFERIGMIKQDLDFKKWIFVDDVFVSGATYIYTKKRVKTEPQAILTLFYKPLGEELL